MTAIILGNNSRNSPPPHASTRGPASSIAFQKGSDARRIDFCALLRHAEAGSKFFDQVLALRWRELIQNIHAHILVPLATRGLSANEGSEISWDIQEVIDVPDVLIRDFPSEDLALLDEQARRLGLSRVEYLRRQLHQTARRVDSQVTVADLAGLGDLIGDLGDESVMDRAWS